MRLQVTLALICLLLPKDCCLAPSSTLNCYQCIPGLPGTCTTTAECFDQCASITYTVGSMGVAKPTEISMRTCGTPEMCNTGSLNLGLITMTHNSKCCSTGLCNSQTMPALPKGSPNGRQCYTCGVNDCTKILNCEGNEDQCISVNAEGFDIKMKGCASKFYCTGSAVQDAGISATGISCCSGNLCNGNADVPVPALKCYQCSPGMPETCTDTAQCPDQCASVTTTTYTAGVPKEVNMKICGTAGMCLTGSLNVGPIKTTMNTKCCNTDLCNRETMPALPKGSPNGRQCYACHNNNCTGTVNCEGDEDQCISITVNSGGVYKAIEGCASRSLCTGNASNILTAGLTAHGAKLSCCSENLCNGNAGANIQAVPALKCFQCSPGMSGTCTDTAQCLDQCASVTITTYTAGAPTEVNMKTCGTAGVCFTGSLNLGLTKTTYNTKCCNTDLCNSQSVPTLPKGSLNGRQCYTCNYNNNDCKGIVNCEGDEDQCIKITVSSADVNMKIKGCASKSLCTGNASSILSPGYGGSVNCCSENLCNSAEGVNLSLLFMLVPLFFSILFF